MIRKLVWVIIMELISTYIETNDFDKSIEFYKDVLQIEPFVFCEGRWVEFECGNKISLYNKKFDLEKINDNSSNYNQTYIDDFNKEKIILLHLIFIQMI